MLGFRSSTRERIVARRAIKTRCQAVTEAEFRLVGERILDLSTNGVLLACDDGVRIDEPILLSINAPGTDEWFDAEGKVARIIEGYRPNDPGYCAGIRFTALDFESWRTLNRSLREIEEPAKLPFLRRLQLGMRIRFAY
ncbi:MAG: PilZ domain-containing protein [Sandaracinaceae bacterium]|nr:PilZ domain-containing protein [Sandaracinaceae bacterium]